jgi:hypothetical protein
MGYAAKLMTYDRPPRRAVWMPLIEDLAKRVDSRHAVIAGLAHCIAEIIESRRNSKSRPIGFTVDIENATKERVPRRDSPLHRAPGIR